MIILQCIVPSHMLRWCNVLNLTNRAACSLYLCLAPSLSDRHNCGSYSLSYINFIIRFLVVAVFYLLLTRQTTPFVAPLREVRSRRSLNIVFSMDSFVHVLVRVLLSPWVISATAHLLRAYLPVIYTLNKAARAFVPSCKFGTRSIRSWARFLSCAVWGPTLLISRVSLLHRD